MSALAFRRPVGAARQAFSENRLVTGSTERLPYGCDAANAVKNSHAYTYNYGSQRTSHTRGGTGSRTSSARRRAMLGWGACATPEELAQTLAGAAPEVLILGCGRADAGAWERVLALRRD
jgi:hypothetical protein